MEPTSHLPQDIIKTYDNPIISDDRLQYAARRLERALHHRMSSNGNRTVIEFDLDVFRICFGIQSVQLLHKEDFMKLPLSTSWYYKLKRNGRGTQLFFSLRVQARLHFKKTFYQ